MRGHECLHTGASGAGSAGPQTLNTDGCQRPRKAAAPRLRQRVPIAGQQLQPPPSHPLTSPRAIGVPSLPNFLDAQGSGAGKRFRGVMWSHSTSQEVVARATQDLPGGHAGPILMRPTVQRPPPEAMTALAWVGAPTAPPRPTRPSPMLCSSAGTAQQNQSACVLCSVHSTKLNIISGSPVFLLFGWFKIQLSDNINSIL